MHIIEKRFLKELKRRKDKKKCKKINEQNIIIENNTNLEPKAIPKNFIINNSINPSTLNPSTIKPLDLITIKKAYGVNNIPLSNGKQLGNGINIAIIIAGLYPNAQKDLDFYCDFYKLPKTKLNLITMGKNIKVMSGWDIEAALDIQSAYTMALGANIYLVQSIDNSFASIMSSIDWCNKNKIDIINMSLGSNEFGQQSTYNKYFTNPNILYVAASGDVSAIPNFPSILCNVLSVGGTTLECDNNNNRLQEYTWNNAGCSPSKFEPKPIYQNGISCMQQMKTRNTPDISANASPQSGVKIYCNGKWSSIGGTSASCPIVCGILAICCEKRKLLKKLPLTSVMNNKYDIHQILYNLSINKDYSTYFYDVKQGTNSIYPAGIGYDIATGCGVLQADKIYNYLTNL